MAQDDENDNEESPKHEGKKLGAFVKKHWVILVAVLGGIGVLVYYMMTRGGASNAATDTTANNPPAEANSGGNGSSDTGNGGADLSSIENALNQVTLQQQESDAATAQANAQTASQIAALQAGLASESDVISSTLAHVQNTHANETAGSPAPIATAPAETPGNGTLPATLAEGSHVVATEPTLTTPNPAESASAIELATQERSLEVQGNLAAAASLSTHAGYAPTPKLAPAPTPETQSHVTAGSGKANAAISGETFTPGSGQGRRRISGSR